MTERRDCKNLINILRAVEWQISIWKRLFDSAFDYGKPLETEAGARGLHKQLLKKMADEWHILAEFSERSFVKETPAVWRKHPRKVSDIKGNTDNWFELCQSGTVRQVKIAGLRRCSPQTQSRRRNFALETAGIVYVCLFIGCCS